MIAIIVKLVCFCLLLKLSALKGAANESLIINNEKQLHRTSLFNENKGTNYIHWKFPNIYPFFLPLFKFKYTSKTSVVAVPTVTSTITVFQQVTEKETVHASCIIAEYTARWKTCGNELLINTNAIMHDYDVDDTIITQTLSSSSSAHSIITNNNNNIHEQIMTMKPSKSSPIPFNTLSPEMPATGLLEGSMTMNEYEYEYEYRNNRNLIFNNNDNNYGINTQPLPDNNNNELINGINGVIRTRTKYVSETIKVTKVDKYMNYQTTQTLLMKHCIPPSNTIPYCTTEYYNSYPKIPLFFYQPINKPINNNNNSLIINSITNNNVSNKVANEMEMGVTIDAFNYNSPADDDFELLFMDYDEKHYNKTK